MAESQSFSLNWKIAGKAGEGVMVVSKILARACKRHGLQAFNYLEYPSLIKGGHQTGQVYAATQGATCQQRSLDVLVTLGKNGFTKHQAEITPQTLIIFNQDAGQLEDTDLAQLGAKIVQIPFVTLSKELTGKDFVSNVIALGASAYFLGFDVEIFKNLLKDEFADKGEKVIANDLAAFDKGYEIAASLGQPIKQTPRAEDKQILLTGNEALGLGSLSAGLGFYAAYPMTPATGLLQFLAAQQSRYPLVVKHSEDEIGAINQAVGASFAGVRAMTGSSGGGIALMTETLSLIGLTEVPLVIVDAQRVGPATGLPTWSAQADLSFVLTAGHGDFPRVVLTPGTVEEHFTLAQLAHHLAEKYQLPVIILSDKFILESHQTMPAPDPKWQIKRESLVTDQDLPEDDSYRRYKVTQDGISPRSLPGQPHGLGITNSYEHDEFGFGTEEIEPTIAQVEKRARKLTTMAPELPQPQLLGPAQAEVTLVGWGSTVNVLAELLLRMEQQTPSQTKVNVVHLPCMWPFPSQAFTKLASQAKKMVMVEGNQSGQGAKLIRQETGFEFADHIRRFDGRPFYVEDLMEYLKNGKN